jgi:hypothetical protein
MAEEFDPLKQKDNQPSEGLYGKKHYFCFLINYFI